MLLLLCHESHAVWPIKQVYIHDWVDFNCFELPILQTWKSLPDSNVVSKEFPRILMTNVEATLDKLAALNMFFIADVYFLNL